MLRDEEQDPPGPLPSYPIESVSNALKLLLMFRHQRTIRVAEAGKALGVARSTAHRLFAMLQYYGFVAQDESTRAYEAGPALVEVGLSVVGLMDIRSHAHPHLLALRDEVGETVHLAQLQGTRVLFLDSIESTRPVRVGGRVGQLMPAHATATGKVLLAEISREELRRRYEKGQLARAGGGTAITLKELERQLEGVRINGYATSFGQNETDVGAVSVPIRDRLGRAVAAIGISAPIERIDGERAASIVPAALQIADRIGSTLA